MKLYFRRSSVLAALFVFPGVALLLASGCSSKPKHPEISLRMGSIVVTNRSSLDIEMAVRNVFQHEGYNEGKSTDEELVWERKGSFLSGAVYSDWYSGGVWERIKVYQHDYKEGQTVVECDGYMVSERDDPLFANEKPEYTTKRSHCQKLMDEVAAELKTLPVGAGSTLTNAPPAATNAPPEKK